MAVVYFLAMSNLITTQQLKEAYLTGVKLVDSRGQPFPNIVFDLAIKSAVNFFELKTKVHTTPTTITDEPHDYIRDHYDNWGWMNLYEYPITEVTSLSAQYPTGQTIIVFPSSWLKIRAKAGQLQLVPTAGSLSQVLIGAGGSYLPLLSGRLSNLPNLFLVSYVAGFAQGAVPDSVNEAIGLRAAIHVMSTSGSAIIEPGVQSKSTSIDGLSQSTSLMVGQFGPYSGRINEYQRRLDDLLATIQQEYKGIMMLTL